MNKKIVEQIILWSAIALIFVGLKYDWNIVAIIIPVLVLIAHQVYKTVNVFRKGESDKGVNFNKHVSVLIAALVIVFIVEEVVSNKVVSYTFIGLVVLFIFEISVFVNYKYVLHNNRYLIYPRIAAWVICVAYSSSMLLWWDKIPSMYLLRYGHFILLYFICRIAVERLLMYSLGSERKKYTLNRYGYLSVSETATTPPPKMRTNAKTKRLSK
jgi:hypothetical protein